MRDNDWREPDAEVLDGLTHWGCMAADGEVLAHRNDPSSVRTPGGGTQPLTGAEVTRVAVRAALRMLLANGVIEAKMPEADDENFYVLLDPPLGDPR